MTSQDKPDDATAEQATTDDIVGASALQLWAAAQTDFDPFQVPAEEWPADPVPIRDADIEVDTGLDRDEVRHALLRLDGTSLVVGRDAGNWSVKRVIPQDRPL